MIIHAEPNTASIVLTVPPLTPTSSTAPERKNDDMQNAATERAISFGGAGIYATAPIGTAKITFAHKPVRN